VSCLVLPGKSFGDFIKSLGQQQTRTSDCRSLATHATTKSSSYTNQSQSHAHSTDSAEHKAAGNFSSVNSEKDLPHSKPPSREKASASEKTQSSVSSTSTPPRLQKKDMSGSIQDIPRLKQQGAVGSNQGVPGSNSLEPPPNQGYKPGPNQMLTMGGLMPGAMVDMQRPKGVADSAVGGPNMPPGVPQMQLRPYQQMFPPGAPRRMILPAEMRPMFSYRGPLGSHPQNLSQQQQQQQQQQQHVAQLYGMHPGNPYFNPYFMHGAAPNSKPSGVSINGEGGNEMSTIVGEPGNKSEGTVIENQSGSNQQGSGTVDGRETMETSKTANNSNIDDIRDKEGTQQTAKTTSGRKNYRMAPTPINEKRPGSASSGKDPSVGGRKEVPGNDSGLGGEIGSNEGGGAGGVLVQSSGAPRPAVRLLGAAHSCESGGHF